MNWFYARIRTSPKAALIAGKAVFLAGALLIVAALFGRIELIGANAERAKTQLPALTKLAEAYPQFPTWMVPEGPVGYSVVAVLVLVGMVLVVKASEVAKSARR
ncbi:MAG: hypothetical protein JWP22_3496 [Ramlibacter sp.]|nr:hypothetical protein [Ramlibacter sp.]MDB5914821.1 hypothetical protein [Ramlibacter sp.]